MQEYIIRDPDNTYVGHRCIIEETVIDCVKLDYQMRAMDLGVLILAVFAVWMLGYMMGKYSNL